VSSAYDAAAHRVTLQIVQDTAVAHTAVFRLPVTIRIGTTPEDIVTHTVVDSARQTIVINDVRRPPTFIVFDDADAIVKTLRFAQPTAWLVAQLQREATPWQTWWAIAQLRDRASTDPTAARALMAAVKSGTYPLTRAHAAAALDAVNTASAVPVLSHALRDTAVIVRRGAVRALGVKRTLAARAALTSAFQHDTSDIVRFDAVAALLGDSTRATADQAAVLKEALRQSSYRDAVRTRAILSAVRITPSASGFRFECDSARLTIVRAMTKDPAVGTAVTSAVSAVNQKSMGMIACFNEITSANAQDTTK
jgi:hypothetical protein